MTNYSQSTFMWTVASLLSVLSGLVIQYSFVAKLTVPQFCPVRDSAERKLSHFRQVPKFFPVVEHLLELCFSFCFPFSRPVGLGRSPRFSGSSRCGLKAAQLPSYQDFSFSLGPRRTRQRIPERPVPGALPSNLKKAHRTVKCVFEFGNVLALGSRVHFLGRVASFLPPLSRPRACIPNVTMGPRPVSLPISSCFTRPRTSTRPRFYLPRNDVALSRG